MDERLMNKSCLVIKTIVRRIKLLSCFFGYFMEWDDSKTLWRLFSIWKVPNFDRKSSIVYQSWFFRPDRQRASLLPMDFIGEKKFTNRAQRQIIFQL